MKIWSHTQAIIALSSGEAEYYGMVRGASEAMGLRSLMSDLGVDRRIRVRTDASAAKSIASRRGLGKVQHIEVNQLWLQEKVSAGDVEVMKVPGESNMADALTKPLDGHKLEAHVRSIGQELESGRHELAPQVEGGEDNWEVDSDDGPEVECGLVNEVVFRKGTDGRQQSEQFVGF